MKIKTGCLAAILLLSGCAKNPQSANTISSSGMTCNDGIKLPTQVPVNRTGKPVAYNDDIRQAASHYGVDETLIKAIIQVESGFNPKVVSASNAVGLMQLKPSTAGREMPIALKASVDSQACVS